MLLRFIDVSKIKTERYVVDRKGTHVFFLYNRSGKLRIEIKKPGAKVYVFGVFLGRNQDSFHLETVQHHLSSASFSELLLKGVFFDRAKIDYNGLIRIEKTARGSHAFQKNQNLLLSKNALVESRPALEILSDDVFCTHGSTTGQPDPEQIFYLQSRGLDRKTATSLLLKGFLEEVFGKIESLGNFPQLNQYKERLEASLTN